MSPVPLLGKPLSKVKVKPHYNYNIMNCDAVDLPRFMKKDAEYVPKCNLLSLITRPITGSQIDKKRAVFMFPENI